MNLDYVSLLPVMRKLQDIPRGQPPDFNGMKRFRHFVRTIFPLKKNGQIDENAVYLIPLLAINPMAKDHVTALLDAYLALAARLPRTFIRAHPLIESGNGDGGQRRFFSSSSWRVAST